MLQPPQFVVDIRQLLVRFVSLINSSALIAIACTHRLFVQLQPAVVQTLRRGALTTRDVEALGKNCDSVAALLLRHSDK